MQEDNEKKQKNAKKFKIYLFIGLILGIILLLFAPPVKADWVITTQGEPGILVLDENGYSHWTQDITISRDYELIDSENVYSKWLFGLLFIFVGAFVLFDAFFNNRFNKFV